jgi:hypothetical protein
MFCEKSQKTFLRFVFKKVYIQLNSKCGEGVVRLKVYL